MPEPRPVRAWPRRLPLATLRIIDLARALAIEPDVLMLDEMTAALPANLTERVLEVIGRRRGGERSVDLHLAPDDRDRRGLRPGDRPARRRDRRCRRRDRGLRGADRQADARPNVDAAGSQPPRTRAAADAPRWRARRRACPCREPGLGRKLARRVVRPLSRARSSASVALEGQGQDELFDVLAGSEPTRTRRGSLVDGKRGRLPPSG